MNRITIVGRLGRDPETRTTATGKSFCTFTVAVDRRGQRDENGEKITDWFNVKAWSEVGETAQRFLAKGRQVAVSGRIEFRRYTAQDGSTRDTHDLVVSDLTLIGDGGGDRQPAESRPAAPRRPEAPATLAAQDDGYDPFGDE